MFSVANPKGATRDSALSFNLVFLVLSLSSWTNFQCGIGTSIYHRK